MATKNNLKKDGDASNRILEIFIAAFAGLIFLAVTRRLMSGQYIGIGLKFLSITCGLSIVAAIAGFFMMLPRDGRKAEKTVTIGKFILRYSVILAFICAAIRFTNPFSAVKLFFAVIPVATVLCLIYCIYNREFFFHSFSCACACFGMWMLSRLLSTANTNRTLFFFGIFIALALAAVALIIVLRKNNGRIGKLVIVEEGANYALLFITYAVILAALTAAFFFMSSAFAYYLIFAVLGYFIVLAIYYTIHMI